MAEDSGGDKTEAPTPRRRQEARDAGQIARSADLTTASLMLAAVLLMTSYGMPVVKACRELMETTFSAETLNRVQAPELSSLILQTALHIAMPLAPIFLGMLTVAVIANVAQVGFFFSPDKLQPNWAD